MTNFGHKQRNLSKQWCKFYNYKGGDVALTKAQEQIGN